MNQQAGMLLKICMQEYQNAVRRKKEVAITHKSMLKLNKGRHDPFLEACEAAKDIEDHTVELLKSECDFAAAFCKASKSEEEYAALFSNVTPYQQRWLIARANANAAIQKAQELNEEIIAGGNGKRATVRPRVQSASSASLQCVS